MDGGTFGSRARTYDEWFERHRPAYLSEIRAVRALLPTEGFGVEVGVGTGRFAGPLGTALGVDISLEMLLLARGRMPAVVAASGERLPFLEETFDYALMVTVLCFAERPARLVREAARVTKRGGRLVAGIIDRESFLGKKYTASKKKSPFYMRAHFLSPEEVVGILRGEGLSPADCRQCIFRDPGAIAEVETPEKGWGEGGFVAISAIKI